LPSISAKKIYFTLSFSMGCLFALIFTLNSVYHVITVGLNPLQLVLVGTALEIAIFVFEVPTGVVADAYSRRLSVIIGMFVLGLGFILEGAWPIFGAVLAAQLVWGMGYTFVSGAQNAWIADEEGAENAGPIYLRGSQFEQIGGLLGIPIGVWLGSQSLNFPLLAGGALYIVLGLFLVLFMPEKNFSPLPREERSSWRAMGNTFREGVQLIRSRRILLLVLVSMAFLGLYSEGFDRLWAAHLLENFTFPAIPLLGEMSIEIWFGILWAGCMLLTLATTQVAKRTLADRPPASLLRVLQIIYGVIVLGLLALALSGHVVIAVVAYLVVDALRNTAYPLEMDWLNQHIDSNVRATVLSMTSQTDALGQMVGGPIVGAIGQRFSLRAALTVSGVILSPVVFLYGRVRKIQLSDMTKVKDV